jgi:uncharacterized membrane protein YgcG
MKRLSKVLLTVLGATAVMLVAGTHTTASAQYVVSARAGLVNYTSGSVTYSTSADPSWREVPSRLQLEEGDRIRTDERGRAEILLNPGSYLRISRGAELILHRTGLTRIGLELVSGSAILEIGNLPDEAEIRLSTPYSVVKIEDVGLYRIDIGSGAMTLAVREGKASYLEPDGSFKKVKDGKVALIGADAEAQIAKLDKRFLDDFDLWSADRAEMLLAANQSYTRRYGWRGYSLFWNAWVFDPFFGYYTFLPWGRYFWSPYGYGYYCPYYGGGYYGGLPGPPTRTLPGGGSPVRGNPPGGESPNREKFHGRVRDWGGPIQSEKGGTVVSRPMEPMPTYSKPSWGSSNSSSGQLGGGAPRSGGYGGGYSGGGHSGGGHIGGGSPAAPSGGTGTAIPSSGKPK